MKLRTAISRPLFILCTLGFLGANSGLVAAGEIGQNRLGATGAQVKHEQTGKPCSPSRIRVGNGCSTSRNDLPGISSTLNANWGAVAGAERNGGAKSKHNGKR